MRSVVSGLISGLVVWGMAGYAASRIRGGDEGRTILIAAIGIGAGVGIAQGWATAWAARRLRGRLGPGRRLTAASLGAAVATGGLAGLIGGAIFAAIGARDPGIVVGLLEAGAVLGLLQGLIVGLALPILGRMPTGEA
jgi:MFS family permease